MDEPPPTIRETCGSYAGYSAHKRHKEIACEECKAALRAYKKVYRELNKEHINLLSNKWREENPEKQKKQLEDYYLKNKEEVKLRAKIWKLNNPEKAKISRANSHKKNPERIRAGKRKRRAILAGVPSEPYTPAVILGLYGTDCHICHEPVDLTAPRLIGADGYERGLHLDHVIPLVLGGSDLIENVKPSHARCNLRKNARMPTKV